MVSFFRYSALSGYFGVLILILLWHTWWSPPKQIPIALVLTILLIPLLFPLSGLLSGKMYTYAWSSFLALFYFALGVSDVYSAIFDKTYGVLMIGTSLLWFIGSISYIRQCKKQLPLNSDTAP